MDTPRQQRPVVHLIGSVPLEDPETVMRTLSAALGAHLRRLPDGETGRRARWIAFVQQHLQQHPDMEVDADIPVYQFKQWDGKLIREWQQLKFKAGVDPSAVVFHTGYADDAIHGFAIFDRLQNAGVIPAALQYQVCIATPLAIAYMFIAPRTRADFTRVYTQHLRQEVNRIAQMLPHDRVALQWDVCQEVLMWEGYFAQPPHYKEEIFSVLGQVGDAVPDTIELGYHLCYGSPRDEHCIQPRDMANMVEITHGMIATMQRPVQYVHMPVPRDRNDDAYFQPLRHLTLPAGTDLYLGLVHDGDEAGNATKLAKARQYTAVAGVGSECGWGRSAPERLPAILAAHRTLMETMV
jgi:hypothetical protein